jgi:hypothetical protein
MAGTGSGIFSIGGICTKISDFRFLLTADYACSIGVIIWYQGVWSEATMQWYWEEYD